MREFTCGTCEKKFTRKGNLLRHQREKHPDDVPDESPRQYSCQFCSKTFRYEANLRKHEKLHTPTWTCSICGRSGFKTSAELFLHETNFHGGNRPQCSSRGQRWEDPLECPPDVETLYHCEDEEIVNCIRQHWREIRTRTKNGKHVDIYTFRLETPLDQVIKDVFKRQKTAFKMNIAFGFILRNTETGEVKYYYPSQNGFLYEEPVLISNEEDLNRFLEEIQDTDWQEFVRRQKPNSKWRVSLLCNAALHIYKVTEQPIGRGKRLPSFIVENRGLDALESNYHTGQVYEDNLCYFRCVARHKGYQLKSLEKKAKSLRAEYLNSLPENQSEDGVRLTDLYYLDKLFGINTLVYTLEERAPGQKPIATLLHRPAKVLSKAETEQAMKLNLCQQHFSYVKDMKKYSKAFTCERCGKVFQKDYKLMRHERACEAQVKLDYPGGVYTPSKTIFEKLEEEGIQVSDELKFSHFFVTFDIEVFYPKSNTLPAKRPKLEYTAEHRLLSVSVAANVPGYLEPICLIVEGDQEKDGEELVKELVTYLNEISDVAYQLEEARYAELRAIIQETLRPDMEDPEADEVGFDGESGEEEDEGEVETNSDREFIDDDREEEDASLYRRVDRERQREPTPTSPPTATPEKPSRVKTKTERLIQELDEHLRQLVVIGFHSGQYDLNVLKRFLIPHLVKNDGGVQFTIKRNQSYLSLKSSKLTFLDVSNFLAAGSSYAGFLRAYGCEDEKGYFPYEWMDSLDKLEESQLPPHEAFYSKLKNTNISEEEYSYCQEVWREKKMRSMRDFLTWYNNLDVGPFIEAVEKMAAFWQGHGIDIFNFISLPGIAMQFEMQFLKQQGIHLSVFNSEELYNLFRENMVGGPAIIFKRYAEADKTYIRNNPKKICQKVVGYDANALYLWALSQPMPVGLYTHWQYAGPKLQPTYPWREADEWLAWASHQRDTTLRTRLNDTEKRLGDRQLPVDGFDPVNNTPYQYMGCYWHGCPSCFDPEDPHPTRGKTYGYWYEKTKDNIDYLTSIGYSPMIQWGCQWLQEKRDNPEIEAYLNKVFPGRDQKGKLKSPTQLLEEVRQGSFFGAVEVDLHVPDHLKPKFEEMTPIFKNVEISLDDIGPHMKQFAEENECMPRPRRALIGSYKAEKILLATPLLQFYLEQGLVVTKVHQAIEWCSRPCFRGFGDFVSTARRNGDQGGSQVVAETAKTVGNAGYGRFIMDSSRHLDIKYEEDHVKVARTINSYWFRDLEEINDGVYEIKSAKKRIKMNLPVQIGFFVYNYAKLRMLEFYYHCIDRFVDRADFELLEMDTDSLYMALAADSVEELIKAERREEFEATKSSWFPRNDTPEHAAYDKRTPGLFKVEWSGQGFVGLNSKTYYCWEEEKDKYSCKGISKRGNTITKDTYLRVLKTQESQSGENRGFRVLNNRVLTYAQFRVGFSYFYPKRKVLSDGISTIPLDI